MQKKKGPFSNSVNKWLKLFKKYLVSTLIKLSSHVLHYYDHVIQKFKFLFK